MRHWSTKQKRENSLSLPFFLAKTRQVFRMFSPFNNRFNSLYGSPMERSCDSNSSFHLQHSPSEIRASFSPLLAGPPLCLPSLPVRKEGRKEALGKRKRNRRREKERGEDACLPGIHYLGMGWGAYRLLNTRLIRREGESGVNVLICIHEPGWQNS